MKQPRPEKASIPSYLVRVWIISPSPTLGFPDFIRSLSVNDKTPLHSRILHQLSTMEFQKLVGGLRKMTRSCLGLSFFKTFLILLIFIYCCQNPRIQARHFRKAACTLLPIKVIRLVTTHNNDGNN